MCRCPICGYKIRIGQGFAIGIHGAMGVGKTTFANYLVRLLPVKSIILPFASPLKQAAKSLGWNGEKDTKGRLLLQRLGTDVVRECIDHDHWVKCWQKQLQELKDSVVIADDLRFQNEFTAVKMTPGFCIKIIGPSRIKFFDDTHASEQPIDDGHFDMLVSNSGKPEDLQKTATATVTHLLDTYVRLT
jgi:tRNA uridine 5-carbamoylmethylation protein Kti12